MAAANKEATAGSQSPQQHASPSARVVVGEGAGGGFAVVEVLVLGLVVAILAAVVISGVSIAANL